MDMMAQAMKNRQLLGMNQGAQPGQMQGAGLIGQANQGQTQPGSSLPQSLQNPPGFGPSDSAQSASEKNREKISQMMAANKKNLPVMGA